MDSQFNAQSLLQMLMPILMQQQQQGQQAGMQQAQPPQQMLQQYNSPAAPPLPNINPQGMAAHGTNALDMNVMPGFQQQQPGNWDPQTTQMLMRLLQLGPSANQIQGVPDTFQASGY